MRRACAYAPSPTSANHRTTSRAHLMAAPASLPPSAPTVGVRGFSETQNTCKYRYTCNYCVNTCKYIDRFQITRKCRALSGPCGAGWGELCRPGPPCLRPGLAPVQRSGPRFRRSRLGPPRVSQLVGLLLLGASHSELRAVVLLLPVLASGALYIAPACPPLSPPAA